jgi:hypothetical protein
LEKAMDDFEKLTGIRPIFGGYHTTQGTKNAIVNLGNQAYLEILAVDDKNTQISAPRWMGADLIETPKITRWALKSTNLTQDSQILKNYQSDMGRIQGGQRKMTNGQLLKWEMIMPLSHPKIELAPFFVDWQNSEAHPTDAMPDQCQLVELHFAHPSPEKLSQQLSKLNLDWTIFSAKNVSIKMEIRTPKGRIQL